MGVRHGTNFETNSHSGVGQIIPAISGYIGEFWDTNTQGLDIKVDRLGVIFLHIYAYCSMIIDFFGDISLDMDLA